MEDYSQTSQDSQEHIRAAMKARTIALPDGTELPALGQGTWYMGEDKREAEREADALRLGLDLGMSVIDTAEMYGDGGAEKVVGQAIAGRRDDVFLVSKALPGHAGRKAIVKACENSLRRLGTDYLDLYLLHWRGSVPLGETAEALEELKRSGKIRRWGVSNLDTGDMEELLETPDGAGCEINQVLYHLGSRGIEYDLLPWQRERRMPTMAYCPIAQGGALRRELMNHPSVRETAERHSASPAQVLLAWAIREGDVLAIPKASSREHVTENAAAAALKLDEDDLKKLDAAFPAPNRKVPLDIV
ncbi:aldo/keto reductase [Saccharibacillus sp. CPCC 101409]|uniref:aldo/keto reductase n=1 Tax=Saccharibacillus sp. CPCC 101409 TaxID=3058041 RepID=UPI0026727CEA|nr:aldo/keto reductase [Saccharibacillus sp. CPCC 101409]MDO3408309.1 aldo/keto reductase [Saccharibacillus sp. CPCC 101409]